MTSQLTRAAVWYARHGWAVFPLKPRSKEPLRLGVYSATPDIDHVAALWAQCPDANIGLHCGGSNLLALDLDTYKDSYQGSGCLGAGDEDTLTSITGNGGTHLLYAVPDGRRWGNKAGNLPPAIDVKCWGGYIVLPPSIHPNGNAYQWETGYRPDEITPRPIPLALARILDDARQPERMPGPPDAIAVSVALKLVLSVLQALDVAASTPQSHERTGRKLTMTPCPFAPKDDPHGNDKASFVIIAPDGHIAAGCLHERCRNRLKAERFSGWQWLLHQRTAEYRTEENPPARRPDERIYHRAGRR